MKKVLMFGLVLSLLLLAIVLVGCSCNGDYSPDVSSEDVSENVSEGTGDGEVAAPQGDELVWVMQGIDVDRIHYCEVCGFMTDAQHNGYMINHETGEIMAAMQGGHGGGADPWVYDVERDLFGHGNFNFDNYSGFNMLGMEEFSLFKDPDFRADRQEFMRRMHSVGSVDSSLREYVEISDEEREAFGYEGWIGENETHWWNLTNEAHTGLFALMINLEFVTDFIFHEVRPSPIVFEDGELVFVQTFAAVRIDDKWAIINVSGEQVSEFIFDDLLIINETTAFAQYGGVWGILDIVASF